MFCDVYVMFLQLLISNIIHFFFISGKILVIKVEEKQIVQKVLIADNHYLLSILVHLF